MAISGESEQRIQLVELGEDAAQIPAAHAQCLLFGNSGLTEI